jgi:hypothetical protein
MLRFEADLKDASAREGWELQGQWPRYYLNHLIPIVIDEKRFKAAAGGRILKTLDTERLIEELRKQLMSLNTDDTRLREFLGQLLEVYRSLSGPMGGSISVWAVYRELVIRRQPQRLWRNAIVSDFHPYPELEFRASLTELLKRNMTMVSGLQLRLHPPIAKEESLYLFQPAENRFCHVGRFEFVALEDRS